MKKGIRNVLAMTVALQAVMGPTPSFAAPEKKVAEQSSDMRDTSRDGTMKTGWHKEGNQRYYLGEDGTMKTGWHKEGNQRYYLGEDGAMKTGWHKEENQWYYLGE
ncbi:N-acetylmuramoyl-L-alanine amidase family protein, partial [Bacillus toyonensis]|uniref:N-acetylmuramoyl-L-alanine amidase family protein n=1 Tax=Bacillus toyonensis TaxID=155322 RepID=UPI00352A3ED1